MSVVAAPFLPPVFGKRCTFLLATLLQPAIRWHCLLYSIIDYLFFCGRQYLDARRKTVIGLDDEPYDLRTRWDTRPLKLRFISKGMLWKLLTNIFAPAAWTLIPDTRHQTIYSFLGVVHTLHTCKRGRLLWTIYLAGGQNIAACNSHKRVCSGAPGASSYSPVVSCRYHVDLCV